MSNTKAVRLTGPGRGAIATVLVDGPKAMDLVGRFFNPHTKNAPLVENVIRFGHWTSGSYSEELVVCRVGDQQVEVHCHGGELASRQIVDSLVGAGATEVSQEDWIAAESDDVFMNAAQTALPDAPTQRVTQILLWQLRGAMHCELASAANLVRQDKWDGAVSAIEKLLARKNVGLHLVSPWSIVLVGPPNAGKSSLINALLGFHRAIVHDMPGTTRDLVRSETAFDGWPVALTDTAGLREAIDPVEAIGIRHSKQQTEQADLLLVVHEASQPMVDPAKLGIAVTARTIHVCTKSDLLVERPDDACIFTSSITGEGIPELISEIVNTLVPNPPGDRDAVPIGLGSVQRLEQILDALKERQKDVVLSLLTSATKRAGED